jgi:Rrf2 family protein
MKITAQEEYGLRCLLRLARAGEGQALTLPEIAGAEKLSVAYVAKLLSVLRQGGFVESLRGRSGGYYLARGPAEIRLGAVLRALGEPLFEDPVYCQQHASPEEKGGSCVHHDGCTLRVLWQTLEQWMRGILDRITLADLLESEGQIAQRLRGHLPENVCSPPGPLLTLAPLSRE